MGALGVRDSDNKATHLSDIDDILVVERQEDVDFPDGGQWEALGLALHLDLLQRKDLPGLPLPCSAHPHQLVKPC